jgi:SAM-dependent methyltransferase
MGRDRPPGLTDLEYRTVNRAGWDFQAGAAPVPADPLLAEAFTRARELVDPYGWIPWPTVTAVLCLASAGGQQAPLFAALGCEVTSLDLSPLQLAKDADVSGRRGLAIRCVEGDMMDLSVLGTETFDLVYQQVSACYVPDVAIMYSQVAEHVRPDGRYFVQHWNPVHLQLDDGPVQDRAYRVVRPQRPAGPIPWMAPGHNGPIPESTCWHYIHSLHDLIGGLTRSGFTIERFAELGTGDPGAEPGSDEHRAAYLPPYFVILAQKMPSRP